MTINTPQVEQFLRLTSVVGASGLSRTGIYAGIAAGTFPPPIRISARAVAWPAATIKTWQDDCIAAAAARAAR
jgi:prophage regulatory protein